MALTRDFKQVIQDMVNSDPKFAVAMLNEAGELLLSGDPSTARLMLRDVVNATIGFETLSAKTSIPAKSLHRMLSASGNPNMESLSTILKSLQDHLRVDLKVVENQPYERPPGQTFAVSEPEISQYPRTAPNTSSERNLESEFTIRGTWWIAKESKRQIPGSLSFGPEQISLSLDGLLVSDSRQEKIDDKFVIQGVDTSGRRWTLIRAFATKVNAAPFGGHKTSELNVTLAFEGIHVDSEDSLQIATLSAEVSDLQASLGRSGLDAKFDAPTAIDVSYKSPPGFSVEIPKIGANLEATRFWTGSFEWYNARIQSSSRLELHYSTPQRFSVASSNMLQIANLISLLHARPARLIDVTAVTPGEQHVSVYFKQKANVDPDRGHALLLAPLSALTEHVGEIVNAWFDLNEQAQTAINVFCNLWRNPGPFGQSDFMHYVQTLESFHRSFPEKKYLSDSQFKKLISVPLKQAIISSEVPPELQESLLQQLEFANQLSQSTRLRRLYQLLPPELAHQLAPNARDFVKRVVEARNYLTHLDYKYKERSISGAKIPFETAGLQLFFIMVVLTRLGVPTDLILRNLPETMLYRKFIHRSGRS